MRSGHALYYRTVQLHDRTSNHEHKRLIKKVTPVTIQTNNDNPRAEMTIKKKKKKKKNPAPE